MNKSINLYPTPPAEWLWHECTDEEKTAYEEDWAAKHQEESPEPSPDPVEPSPEPVEPEQAHDQEGGEG